MKSRIDQVEPEFAQKLDQGLPFKEVLKQLNFSVPDERFQIRVSLRDSKRRKKPSHAAAGNWSPESADRVEIWYEPAPPQSKPPIVPSAKAQPLVFNGAQTPSNSPPPSAYAVADLVQALNRAELRPGWRFVPLKKFRDEILPSEQFSWAASGTERRRILQSAIDQKFIVLGHVENPKPPHIPVTTIRLNRLVPEVRGILGFGQSADGDFHPVEIKGEPLSATVLRERR